MLVSIIMPTYNCGNYIVQAIESVISQTFKDWELIIVDDFSTDNTRDLLEPYLEKYSNIHYSCLASNQGPAAARTEALRNAKGKYVAFLDSDDLWLPKKLEIQITYMEKNNIDMCCTGYRQMDCEGVFSDTILMPPKRTDYKLCILLGNPIGNLTVVYNQEKLGRFSVPDIRKRNDFALWLQVLKKTRYCYGLQKELAVYRLGRKDSVSHKKISLLKYHWQLYHEIEKHTAFRSAFEVFFWAANKGLKISNRIMQVTYSKKNRSR